MTAKLDIIVFLITILSFTKTPSGSFCSQKPVDVVFALDSSSSIWEIDFQKQLGFVENVVDRFPIGMGRNEFRVGVVTFSHHVSVEFHLMHFNTKDKVKRALRRIEQLKGGTYTYEAIRHIRKEMFKHEYGGRRHSAKVVVVITDGLSQNTTATMIEASLAHSRGIEMFAIGVGAGIDEMELKSIASEPKARHFYMVDSYSILNTLKDTLAIGTCPAKESSIEKARSDIDPTLIYPEEPRTQCGGKPAEVYFVLDSSSSIWKPDFDKQLSFVEDVAGLFDTEPKNTRIGIVIFSNSAYPALRLGAISDKNQLRQFLKRPNLYRIGETNTADAIRYVREVGMKPGVARRGAAHVMIVLTDGQSNDPKQTAIEAKKAHDQGIYIFAIGIGRNADTAELKTIASDPDLHFVFRVDIYDALESIKDILAIKTCQVEPPVNNPTEKPKSKLADVMFLIDAWGSGVKDSELIRNFIADAMSNVQLGADSFRAGVFTSSCPHDGNIYLGKHRDTHGFTADVRNQNYLGVEGLLRRVRHHGFEASNGGRLYVPHVAVLFVSRKLHKSNHAVREAERVKFKKIKLFVVAIGTDYDENEVRTLCSSPSERYLLRVGSFKALHEEKRHFLIKLMESI